MSKKNKAAWSSASRTKVDDQSSKITELEAQLNNERKLNLLLRTDAEKKIQSLQATQEDTTVENDHFQLMKDDIRRRTEATKESFKGMLARLYSVEKNLRCDVAGIDIVESENDRLKQRLRSLTAEHSIMAAQQEKERLGREANSFDIRMQLEQILRQQIKSQNDLYVTQSVLNMEASATLAKKENSEIIADFENREKKCFDLIRQQEQSYENLLKMQMERAVITETLEFEEENAATALRRKIAFERSLHRLSEVEQDLETEVLLLAGQLEKKRALALHLQSMQSDVLSIQRSRRKARHAAVVTSQRLLVKSLAIASMRNPMNRQESISTTSGDDTIANSNDDYSERIISDAQVQPLGRSEHGKGSMLNLSSSGSYNQNQRNALGVSFNGSSDFKSESVWCTKHADSTNKAQIFSTKMKKFLLNRSKIK